MSVSIDRFSCILGQFYVPAPALLGSNQPYKLLEELYEYETAQQKPTSEVEELAAEIKGQFTHWLLRFPAQCVLTAEAIMWERSVFRALDKQDKIELANQK